MSWLKQFLSPKPSRAKTIEAYSLRVFEASVIGANTMIALVKDSDIGKQTIEEEASKQIKMLFEFQILYLHLTDRFAFGRIDENRRGKIMSELVEWTLEGAITAIREDWSVEKIAEAKNNAWQHYISQIQEYAKCKIVLPGKDDGMSGSVIWEFGKAIAGILEFDMDIAYISGAMMTANEGLQTLDSKSFFEQMG